MTKLTDHQISSVELYLNNTFYIIILVLLCRNSTQEMFADWGL